jgi:hypothetical protein
MPNLSRLHRRFPALTMPAAVFAVLMVAAAPASAAENGLLDTMLRAALEAPAKLYEGKAKNYRAGVMTPDTLKACLILAHRIDAVSRNMESHRSTIRDLDARIQEAGPRLQNQAMAALTDPAKRETYEAQIADYNAWVEQRRAAVESHNRGVRLFSEMSGRFNGECNGRAYFPSDLAVVKPELPPEIAQKLP